MTEAPRGFAGTAPAERDALLGAPVRTPRPSRLDRALELSPKAAEGAAALGLHTVGDLLEHVPRARREARTVGALAPGETATVLVEVRAIAARPVRRRGMRPLVEATVADATGPMQATFFNQPWLVKRYEPGTRLVLHGKYEGRNRFRVSNHATTDEAAASTEEVSHYAASEGLSSTQILALVSAERAGLREVVDPLPGRLRARLALAERGAALEAMHFGNGPKEVECGRERLAFEELLYVQLALLARRAREDSGGPALALDGDRGLTERWLSGGLPFALTADQLAAIEQLREELGRGATGSAAADGRGGQRQDGGRAVRDAARGRARLPGGADGADRDARRSSTSRRSSSCSAASRSRSRCSPARRRPRDAPSCSRGWRAASAR